MQLIKNIGADRVLDHLQSQIAPAAGLDAATDGLSLFAFEALKKQLDQAGPARLLLSSDKPALVFEKNEEKNIIHKQTSITSFRPILSAIKPQTHELSIELKKVIPSSIPNDRIGILPGITLPAIAYGLS